jgi:hypothetical protein
MFYYTVLAKDFLYAQVKKIMISVGLHMQLI